MHDPKNRFRFSEGSCADDKTLESVREFITCGAGLISTLAGYLGQHRLRLLKTQQAILSDDNDNEAEIEDEAAH